MLCKTSLTLLKLYEHHMTIAFNKGDYEVPGDFIIMFADLLLSLRFN